MWRKFSNSDIDTLAEKIMGSGALPLKFNLLRFTNAEHYALSRILFGAIGFAFCFLITFRVVLAKDIYTLFFKNDYKTALRRLAWYARRGWPKAFATYDPSYDFTEDMSLHQLAEVEAFIVARKSHIKPQVFDCDTLYIHARKLHPTFGTKKWEKQMLEFCSTSRKILSKLPLDFTSEGLRDLRKTNAKKRITKEAAIEALSNFISVVPPQSTPWYVVSGTFLGIVRENGFLAHDYDIDLGINAEDVDLDILEKKINSSRSFTIRKNDTQTVFYKNAADQPTMLKRPVLMKILHRNGLVIDLFIHYKFGETRWHGSSIHRWNNLDFSLSDYTLVGHTVFGPTESDQYLTENYGNWKVPVTDFNCTTDTTNQSIVKNPSSVALFIRRMAFAFENKDDDAQDICTLLEQNGLIHMRNGQREINPAAYLRPLD